MAKEGYTEATGNSSPEDKVRYKMMRGEDLSNEEWKIYREMKKRGEVPEELKTYDTTPF